MKVNPRDKSYKQVDADENFHSGGLDNSTSKLDKKNFYPSHKKNKQSKQSEEKKRRFEDEEGDDVVFSFQEND